MSLLSIKYSEFRNKILMPILFDNATRNVTMGDSPRKRIGHEVIERKKKMLLDKVRDLYKRKDYSKKQSLALPGNTKSSKSLSITKLSQSQTASTLFLATPGRCKIHNDPNSEHKGKLYRTNLERLQLVNEIQERKMATTSSHFRTRQQPALPIHRTTSNVLELDFETEYPKLSYLKWLIEAYQYNADRMEYIRKKIEMKNMKIRTLAEREKEERNVYIVKYIDNIDVEGVDNKQIQQREELNERFKDIPGFLEELAKKEQLRDYKFKSPVKRAANIDSRLATARQTNSPFVKGLFQQTAYYERWKSPLNRDLYDNMRVLEEALHSDQPTYPARNKIMLEYLKESRLDRLAQI